MWEFMMSKKLYMTSKIREIFVLDYLKLLLVWFDNFCMSQNEIVSDGVGFCGGITYCAPIPTRASPAKSIPHAAKAPWLVQRDPVLDSVSEFFKAYACKILEIIPVRR